MKKITLTLFALCMTFMSLNAQDGRIIYVDNIYPSIIYAQALYGGFGYPTNEPSSIFFDFDYDWLNDLEIYFNAYKTCHLCYYTRCNSNWQFTTDRLYHEGDTLSMDSPYYPQLGWTPSPTPEMVQDPYGIGNMHEDGVHFIYVRYPKNDGFCYGWIRFTLEMGESIWPGPINPDAMCHLQDYAFCTIPDYPLRVGQTSLGDDIVEHDATSIMVYPNPVRDYIKIEYLNDFSGQSIDIYSIDGRLVETFPEASQQTQIDISSLNSGVYLIKLKTKDGKEFSERIVKE